MECRYCIDDLHIEAVIYDIETKCKYHKKQGAVYSPASLVPKGICKELFYAAYPGSLAVLYSGKPRCRGFRKKGIQEITATCPHPQGIKVLIKYQEVLPAFIRKLKEICEEIVKVVYRPFDAHFRRVLIEVIEESSHCPKGYTKGTIFTFNTGKTDELCPAGFAAIYPYARILKACKDKGNCSGSMKVHCPDHVGVTYEIKVT